MLIEFHEGDLFAAIWADGGLGGSLALLRPWHIVGPHFDRCIVEVLRMW